MATHKKHVVPFRRKREGKTDYRLRLKLLMGRKPRLVVRLSNAHVSAQIVIYKKEGDVRMTFCKFGELICSYSLFFVVTGNYDGCF